ncbi:hypothetical protein GOB94_01260 [Granulicella sp. 5B5]|uniref:hypothetical protein n=1 Tax=Granulicella sp. 5B5 TaxID=1617967 RepID=UPI0015F4EF68|nr:hypothetical protein [Granulicella sp. 5B5]QMV17489.1 hypothetical protein GOB94_01260 [Granulicella sp. 5B5]
MPRSSQRPCEERGIAHYGIFFTSATGATVLAAPTAETGRIATLSVGSTGPSTFVRMSCGIVVSIFQIGTVAGTFSFSVHGHMRP